MLGILGLITQLAGVIAGLYICFQVSVIRGLITTIVVLVAYPITAKVAEVFMSESLMTDEEKSAMQRMAAFGEAGLQHIEQPKAWTRISQIFLILYLVSSAVFITFQLSRH